MTTYEGDSWFERGFRKRLYGIVGASRSVQRQHATKIYALALGILLLSLSFASVATVKADSERQYLVGTGLLCAFAGACPDTAVAPSNGNKLYLAGSGTFEPGSGEAGGGGSVVRTNSLGTILAFGTWTAEALVSFTPGGFSTLDGLLPSGSEGGVAVLEVHISPATGGAGFTALLTINCALATPGVSEGITLAIVGGTSFSTSTGGATLFIAED